MLNTTEATSGSFSAVSSLLWREREALQLLLFKLIEQQLILTSGQPRLLNNANQEIELALDQVRCTEVLRAAEMGAATPAPNANSHGTTEQDGLETSLAEFAASAPEPWATVLTEHRQALLTLTAEVEQATDANRVLLLAGASAVRETLQSITQSVDTYDAHGTTAGLLREPILMDEHA